MIATEIEVLKLEPYGCDTEGDVLVRLPIVDREFWANYQANDHEAAKLFPIGVRADVLMYLVYGDVERTSTEIKSVSQRRGTRQYLARGIYRARHAFATSDLHHIDSEFPILVNEEPAKGEQLSVGVWVKSEGIFFIDYLEYYKRLCT